MIRRIGIAVLGLILMAAWADVSLAVLGAEVSGDLTISNSGKLIFPDGSAQTT